MGGTFNCTELNFGIKTLSKADILSFAYKSHVEKTLRFIKHTPVANTTDRHDISEIC